MRILVCGGRDFDNTILLDKVLDSHNCENLTIIEGGAKGADLGALHWARRNNVPVETYRADWNKYGKRAGYIRNVQMLNEGNPDLVIAFPGGKGTSMMIKLAEAAGVPVVKIND